MIDEVKKKAGKRGGTARSVALSGERKKEIAAAGALARWGAQATHKGNFKEEFGVDVECYVLNDSTHTAVISQTGMGIALGLAARGNAFPRFLATQGMAEALGAELAEKIKKPLKFQWASPGAQQVGSTIVFGYDVTILIDVCKAVIQADAEGKLRNRHVARQAAIIIAASAKAGIKGLVYALSGYDATKEEVIQAFRLYVREEARKYEQEFPNELYDQWYRLYEIPPLARGKPWHFLHLTVNHIYVPLAKSNGKLLELLRAIKARGGDRRIKLFQFLNDVGARALRMQIGRVLEMAEDAESKSGYEAKITKRFGGQQEFEFASTPEPKSEV